MLSTLTMVSIFAEIFTAGILIAGAVTFFRRYQESESRKDAFFAFTLTFFSLKIVLTIASQLLFNVGIPLSQLILVNRFIAVDTLWVVFLLWLFLLSKFKLKGLRWVRWVTGFLALISLVVVYRILISELSLIYREDVIEPLVDFSHPVPLKTLWVLVWLALAAAYFWKAFLSKGGRRQLSFMGAFSSLAIFLAYLATVFYSATAQSVYLLASWLISLFGAVGLILSEVIPPESKIALSPLSFFRTRILFKLVAIIVLLIVILFEATTLVTIAIGKSSLSFTIVQNQEQKARQIRDKVEAYLNSEQFSRGQRKGELNLKPIEDLICDLCSEGRTVIYLVDGQGRLLVHPDLIRAKAREDYSGYAAVKNLLRGREGAGEFYGELGEKMVGAYVRIKSLGWGVVVEEPVSEAYFPLRTLETNSLLFIITGMIITSLVGIYFARNIERPIKDVISGTEAIRKGDLSFRIPLETQDEIGELAMAFNQMTAELRESQDRLILSEKLASLGTMAAGMAHEIKNPLVSLRTFTQLLPQKWQDPEYREKFAAIVPQEIERINKIAESLLKFGRPIKPELTKVEVNTVLEEVILLFESECKKNNVRVTTKFADLPQIVGDASQLSQAFVNIALNAIQAMSGGGELTFKTDVGEVIKLKKPHSGGIFKRVEGYGEMSWGEVEAGAGEEGEAVPAVFVEVTDTGEGIAEENLKSLFDPFFTTKVGGTGMGLPITLRIIEEHKGSVKVRSQTGKGTTFLITLPQNLEQMK